MLFKSFLKVSSCFNTFLIVIMQVNAKISDFGIAIVASDFSISTPQGTTGYRAPEVIAKQHYGQQVA